MSTLVMNTSQRIVTKSLADMNVGYEANKEGTKKKMQSASKAMFKQTIENSLFAGIQKNPFVSQPRSKMRIVYKQLR